MLNIFDVETALNEIENNILYSYVFKSDGYCFHIY